MKLFENITFVDYAIYIHETYEKFMYKYRI